MNARPSIFCGLTLGALLIVDRRAAACDCRGAEGIGGSVTASNERWAIGTSLTVRRGIASWSATGRARLPSQGVMAYDASLPLSLGVRPWRPLELAVMTGPVFASLRSPGFDSDRVGWSDTTVRARVDLARESTFGGPPVGLSGAMSVRMPTASASSAPGSNAVGSFGLGTWEVAVAVDARRTLGPWQPFAAVEAALRAPDVGAGAPRALGPRVSGRVGASYYATPRLNIAAMFDLTWEGDVAVAGQTLAGTWQHRSSVALMLTGFTAEGSRTSVSIATDLPVDSLGRNAEATFRVSLSVVYGTRNPAWNACGARLGVVAARQEIHVDRHATRL